ncbi:MAG TPA: HD domain-containing phosphohydrolase, partial [Anaerolineales bacterium]|nr:HD domain-containing phosphohydrolase [Anaerolineales bacterium]
NAFEDSILRVLNGDSIVGAAFLVSDRLVATCAHVLKSAEAKVGGKISLRLSNGEAVEAIVESEFWRAENAEDISILRLDDPLKNTGPLILGSSSGTKGHNFSTFGFPKQGQEFSGSGEIIGRATIDGIELLQLDSRQVTPGFSGAPIFDEITKRVVGMVVAITPPDEYQRLGTTAFAIPAETIRAICPELQISDICPYRSLDVFNEEDAPFFFGRERVVEKMVDSLKREPRFLAILGPSGSGKSSVIRAGLIPALRQGKVPGSDRWDVITIRPANEPFAQLDSAGLSNSEDGMGTAIRNWLDHHPEKTRFVLVIDQFEEVLVSTPEEIRYKFIKELATLLDAPVEIAILLALRDDFYSRFLQDAAVLTSWLEHGLVNIPSMLEQNELRTMVIEPAKQVGLSFEEGLVDSILVDAAEANRTKGTARCTILPLLEFALTQLWERRQQGKLTHDTYNAIGGVTGGLTQWADQAYYNLTPEERETARYTLSELVRPGNDEQSVPDTRRVRALANMLQHNQTLSRRVIDRLVLVRLLSTWRDEETGSEKIEIIHDALLREWRLLRDWIAENRTFLAWRDGLETQIRKWEESQKNDDALLHGLQLIEAEEWLATRTNDIPIIGQQFIETSIASREKEKAEKESLQKQAVRMVALRDIDSAMASSFDLRLTLNILMDQILKLLNVDAVVIGIYHSDSQTLAYLLGVGFNTPSSTREQVRIGDGLAGQVIMKQQTCLITDLQNATDAMNEPLIKQEGFITYLGLPLIVKGHIQGVLEIFHRAPLSLTPDWMEFLQTLAGQAAIAIDNSRLFDDLQRSNQELMLAYDVTLEGWARALELRDRGTEGHTRRVTELTLRLARYIGISANELVNIYRGALLHDIGNMGIPDAILKKPGSLTSPEWDVMRQHPIYAYNLLAPIPYLRSALDIPYCHHEHWDGSGYPRGLKGEQIPLAARVFSIVDTFDLLLSDRPYRRGWQKEDALKYIQEQAGKLFDPKVVEAFLNMLSE